MASWQQQKQYRPHSGAFAQPPSYGHYANSNPQSASHQPAPFQRKKSEFKSLYPLTKWCAVYKNTNTADTSGDYVDNEVDLTSPIPSTNCYLPMDLEEQIIEQIDKLIDEEKELTTRLEQQKLEVQQIRDEAEAKAEAERLEAEAKVEAERQQKIETYMSWSAMTDRNAARRVLEDNGWDVNAAIHKQFASASSLTDVASAAVTHPSEGQSIEIGGAQMNGINVSNGGYNANSKSVIRVILPDHRQYTYQMDAHDTFWAVFGRILTSVPELNQKAFNLVISSNGHQLKEEEFDQTLSQANLVPNGEILIKY